jgi:hypothetical protein
MFHEDNQAMIRVCETGRNPTMRYLLRTHRVSIAWLHERFSQDFIKMFYEESSTMCGDIYTKGFTDVARWIHACNLINVIDPAQLASFCNACFASGQQNNNNFAYPLSGGGHQNVSYCQPWRHF